MTGAPVPDNVATQIADEYARGFTFAELGQIHGVNPSTARNVVRRLGVTVRPPGQRKAEARVRLLPSSTPEQHLDEAHGGDWVVRRGIRVWQPATSAPPQPDW